jgi:hypothetical protein
MEKIFKEWQEDWQRLLIAIKTWKSVKSTDFIISSKRAKFKTKID